MENTNLSNNSANLNVRNFITNIKDFFSGKKKAIILGIVILTALSLPLVINQVMQQQDIRQRAGNVPCARDNGQIIVDPASGCSLTAANDLAQSGDTLILNDGDHIIPDGFEITKVLILKGKSRNAIIKPLNNEQTILRVTNMSSVPDFKVNFDQLSFGDGVKIKGDNTTELTIQNSKFESGKIDNSRITSKINALNKIVVKDNTFVGNAYITVIDIDTQAMILNNFIDGLFYQGIGMDSATDVTIKNNFIKVGNDSSLRNGISISQGSNLTIQSNTISNNTNGITTFGNPVITNLSSFPDGNGFINNGKNCKGLEVQNNAVDFSGKCPDGAGNGPTIPPASGSEVPTSATPTAGTPTSPTSPTPISGTPPAAAYYFDYNNGLDHCRPVGNSCETILGENDTKKDCSLYLGREARACSVAPNGYTGTSGTNDGCPTVSTNGDVNYCIPPSRDIPSGWTEVTSGNDACKKYNNDGVSKCYKSLLNINATPALSTPTPTAISTPKVTTVCGGPITIKDTGSADPYGSIVTIGTSNTSIIDLDIQLNGLQHSRMNDIDMMLVSPNKKNAIIMSDVGGNNKFDGSITIDDNAKESFSGYNPPKPGDTLKPSNQNPFGATDTFPGNIKPSGQSSLSTFNLINPSGDWKLFIVDDSSNYSGAVKEWCLKITTMENPPIASPTVADITATVTRAVTGTATVTRAVTGTVTGTPPQITPIPIPADHAAINVSLRMPGIGKKSGENASPRRSRRLATLTVHKTDAAETQIGSEKIGTVDYDTTTGRFKGKIGLGKVGTLSNQLAAGNYIIKVKFDNTLKKKYPGVIKISNTQSNSSPDISIISGNTDTNNEFDMKDYNNIIACFKGESACTSVIAVLADLNDNGINRDDYDDIGIAQRNFNFRIGD